MPFLLNHNINFYGEWVRCWLAVNGTLLCWSIMDMIIHGFNLQSQRRHFPRPHQSTKNKQQKLPLKTEEGKEDREEGDRERSKEREEKEEKKEEMDAMNKAKAEDI